MDPLTVTADNVHDLPIEQLRAHAPAVIALFRELPSADRVRLLYGIGVEQQRFWISVALAANLDRLKRLRAEAVRELRSAHAVLHDSKLADRGPIPRVAQLLRDSATADSATLAAQARAAAAVLAGSRVAGKADVRAALTLLARAAEAADAHAWGTTAPTAPTAAVAATS